MRPRLVRIAGGHYVELGPTEKLASAVLNAKAAPQNKSLSAARTKWPIHWGYSAICRVSSNWTP